MGRGVDPEKFVPLVDIFGDFVNEKGALPYPEQVMELYEEREVGRGKRYNLQSVGRHRTSVRLMQHTHFSGRPGPALRRYTRSQLGDETTSS